MISNQELQNILGEKIIKIEEIRNKDGVSVSRIFYGDKTCVLKYFENKKFIREIDMYKFVKNLGIKTLQILHYGENYILMEDINASNEYRLAVEGDLKDNNVLKNLAHWYRDLHQKGKMCDLKNLYDENDVITIENIKKLATFLEEKDIDFLLKNYSKFINIKNQLTYTLTYNDFAYENLIVGENTAFMYDYNFLGKGYLYADIQNVLSMLDDEKKEYFLKCYGEKFNDLEVIAYKVLQPISALISASFRPKFPAWAKPILSHVKSPNFKSLVGSI